MHRNHKYFNPSFHPSSILSELQSMAGSMKEFFGGHFRPRHAMNFAIEKEETFVPDAGVEGGGGPRRYYILE